MDNELIEWIELWDTETLHVSELKKGNRSIYVLSNPLTDDAVNIEGKELVQFVKELLKNKESEEKT